MIFGPAINELMFNQANSLTRNQFLNDYSDPRNNPRNNPRNDLQNLQNVHATSQKPVLFRGVWDFAPIVRFDGWWCVGQGRCAFGHLPIHAYKGWELNACQSVIDVIKLSSVSASGTISRIAEAEALANIQRERTITPPKGWAALDRLFYRS